MASLLEQREQAFKYVLEVKGYDKAFEDAFMAQMGAVYSDGALKAVEKRLMALTAALVAGRDGCIMSQTLQAIDAGATVEQIMEACLVSVSMGGTLSMGGCGKVRQLLHEKGLIK